MARDVPDAPPPPPSADSFRLLLDEVAAYVYVTDIEGRFTYANRLVLDLLGQTRLEDVLGKAFIDFVDLDDEVGASLRETDRQVLRDGVTIEREEANYIHAHQELRIYWTIKRPLRDPSGAILGMIGISHDITEQKRLERRLREQQELLGTVLNNLDAHIFMKDGERRYTFVNRKLANGLGLPLEEIVGRSEDELLPGGQPERLADIERTILERGEPHVGEVSFTAPDGSELHFWNVTVRAEAPGGGPSLIGVSTDVTELFRLKERLRVEASSDALTGLANRRSFWERAEAEFARCRRHGAALSLIAIDLDHFKEVNDRFGHPTGDRVLRAFASCCNAQLRAEDLCARMGGEEFSVLLPETTLAGARAVAERIRDRTSRLRFEAPMEGLSITGSFGVVALGDDDTCFEHFFVRADRALYVAKDAGRDRIVSG